MFKNPQPENYTYFKNQIKLFVNQQLFEKRLISEDMYHQAKERLQKESLYREDYRE